MNLVLTGDSVEMLKTIESGTVQCCVTSPPYDKLRTYKNGVKWDFKGTARELYRVLCPGGVLCWNVGDAVVSGAETLTSMRQAIYFVDVVGFRMHDTMIWKKSNFANPEKVRYHQLFEYVFVLSKGVPRTFNPIKDKKNVYAGTGTVGDNTARQPDGSFVKRKRNIIEPLGMRGNVWEGNTRGQEDMCEELKHPAMMPRWLARDLIRSWSNPGDIVLDPFAGSGTTGQEAKKLGRKYILIDNESEYVKELIKPSLEAIDPLFAEGDEKR